MNSPVSVNSLSRHTLADWLAYIEASHPIDKIELGLERVLKVAERGQLQQLPGIKILIGGTNGKGSSARCLEQLLLAQGYRVGVYSSPHLLRFNERLRINDQDVSDELWVQGLSQVEALRAEVALTYFEFTTLAAFAILKQQQVDICLIEVGLGGRLDATNIISPDASILTTVDLDHQDFLGNDRESIGREKAGIFRANAVTVIGDPNPPRSVLAQAELLHCRIWRQQQDFSYHLSDCGTLWHWHCAELRLSDLPLPQLPLQNMASCLTCLAALALLPSADIVAKVLKNLTLAGRMQWLQSAPAVMIDVAHNPQSAAYLASQLAGLKPRFRQVHALAGMLKDKDVSQSLCSLAPWVQQWHCVTLPPPRGAAAEQLAAQLPPGSNVQCYDALASAWQQLKPQLHSDDLVLVFGSFVTVSQFLTLWQQEKL
jgi:dihydrofolate synthase/folylpolyglutamate synthase